MNCKVLAIIQARMGSSRLTNKVMMPIAGIPSLGLMVNRLWNAKRISDVVIATTQNKEDDTIDKYCKEIGATCFRGDAEDVLKRFYECQLSFGAANAARLTGDCPFIDPEILDELIELHITRNADYSRLSEKYAEGLDAEIIKLRAITIAHENAKKQSEREHVTLFINNNRQDFNIQILENNDDDSRIRITLDNIEDYLVLKIIGDQFKKQLSSVSSKDIIKFIRENQSIFELNKHIKRNEGLQISLAKEKRL